jgi:hypothetical protein
MSMLNINDKQVPVFGAFMVVDNAVVPPGTTAFEVDDGTPFQIIETPQPGPGQRLIFCKWPF